MAADLEARRRRAVQLLGLPRGGGGRLGGGMAAGLVVGGGAGGGGGGAPAGLLRGGGGAAALGGPAPSAGERAEVEMVSLQRRGAPGATIVPFTSYPSSSYSPAQQQQQQQQFAAPLPYPWDSSAAGRSRRVLSAAPPAHAGVQEGGEVLGSDSIPGGWPPSVFRNPGSSPGGAAAAAAAAEPSAGGASRQ